MRSDAHLKTTSYVRYGLIFICLSALALACADAGDLSDRSSQDKSSDTWSMEEGDPWVESDDSDFFSSEDVDQTQSTPWESDPYSTESERATSEEVVTTNGVSAVAGERCGQGCVWSAYAVNIGAQSGEADCGYGRCACVTEGDVWQLCGDPSREQQTSTSPDVSEPSTGSGQSAQNGYNASVGNRIADEAYYQATRRNTVGYCYSAAADAIESVVGAFLYGASAYMAADQLANHPRFTEVRGVSLPSLPAGAVVVWGRGTSAHGHISIALGDGREASDHIAQQMTYHYGGAPARVFYPH